MPGCEPAPVARIAWLRDDPARDLSALAARLPAAEQAELAEFASTARRRGFILSRTLLRHLLSPCLQRPESGIRFCRAESGRLQLADDNSWHISISHADGLVAVIVAEMACGVDIEQPRALKVERVAQRYFADAEKAYLAQSREAHRQQNFFRLWTLKEAAVKALHQGLAGNLSRLAFSLDEQTPRPLDAALGLQCWQKAENGFVLAAAVASPEPVRWDVQAVSAESLG